MTTSGEHRNEIAPHVAAWIRSAIETAPKGYVPLLFLSGPQGSGKSTALEAALSSLSMPVAGLSIDDVYLPLPARERLAREISPLFITRGPPGTHDLALLRDTIEALRAAKPTSETPLPTFDKLSDDRRPEAEWPSFKGRPAAIVIEGWLMGALPDANSSTSAPINEVETEDASGAWRAYQEAALAGDYAALWDEADGFFHIVPDGFERVLNWRLEQEVGLWENRCAPMPGGRREWVVRFIAHYERITRRMISGARRPGSVLHIDALRRTQT
ncbi:hypothetical protein K1X12_07930 [Hyphomonas sp. WL0036]|uniref:hypothetical protein n=1 Tax=Hyphomonas sediminis TaxID=2866160 RepID=UPI001C80EF6B|nr:hypothetical protein [Hyphomonas sediminis]MBY9066826.1 hypothetical protein [Hyphomonas sediminis]